jgi:hypothetical protein
MPEPTTTVTPTETGITPPAHEPTPQQTTRQEVYAKYYGSERQEEAPAPTPTETTAQVDPTPVEQEPAPAQTLPPTDVAELIRSLQTEIASLKTSLAPKPTPAPAPAPATEEVKEDWIELLRAGKQKEAEELFARQVAEKIGPQLAQQSVEETTRRLALEKAINDFNTDLRVQNPDLVPLEDLISVKAQLLLDNATKSGKIQNDADFIREYKAAVQTAAEEGRKIVRLYRGEGKTEALTTKTQVLSATPLTPNPVAPPKEQTEKAPSVETPQDYLAKRLQRSWERRGITSR